MTGLELMEYGMQNYANDGTVRLTGQTADSHEKKRHQIK